MQEQFHRYCLTKEIANKPSESVYLAYPINQISQKVVLKIFKSTSLSSGQQGNNFHHHLQKIKQLKHSAIVPILDFGIEQGQFYVVRQYLTSSSLRHRLDHLSPERLDLQEVLSMIFQIGKALCCAHQHHILHGSLKPENIFFNEDGEVLITDFGLTSFINKTKQDTKSHRQTTSYLAPEQLVGSATEKSDQYALACLTYELLTGYASFSPQSLSLIVFPPSTNGASTTSSEQRTQESQNHNELNPAEIACENSLCPDYGKLGHGNIRKFGKTRKGVQRWQCKTCQMTWSFPSLSAKHQVDLIPLTDLVPNLPEPIEEVVLKAMAKDPSERYAIISVFLQALQVALVLPPSPSSNSLIASPVTPPPTSIIRPFENISSEAVLSTPLLEHWKSLQNDFHASKVLAASNSDTYHSNKPTAIPNSDAYRPNKPTPLPNIDTYHSNKPTPLPNSDAYHPNKPVTKPKLEAYHASKDLIEATPEIKHPQSSKPLAPTLWLAFALSGIILLLGTLVLYSLAPLRSPASPKPVKNISTAQPSVQITTIPTAQPSVQVHSPTTPIVQLPTQVTTVPTASSTAAGIQIEPSVSNSCNGPNWSRPSNNANNDYPDDAYYVVTLNDNASCYKANWSISSGPTLKQTCDFSTLFTRGTNAQVTYTFTTTSNSTIPFNININSPVLMTFSSLGDITSIQLVAQDNHQSGTSMSAGPFMLSKCH